MNRMAWVRVNLESTTLAAATYDAEQWELQLDFRDGGRYLYSGVRPELFADFTGAPSKGRFFNRHIRDCFPYAKLAPEN